jgi:hypothetical protein
MTHATAYHRMAIAAGTPLSGAPSNRLGVAP